MKENLVVWGTGNICKTCLIWNKQFNPDFYIDRNWQKKEFYGKKVLHPDEISDWDKLFIIIAVLDGHDIKQFLKAMGLMEKEDFIDFKDFFSEITDAFTALVELKERLTSFPRSSIDLFIVAPIFTARQNTLLLNLFKQYLDANPSLFTVIQAPLRVLKKEMASDYLNTIVFDEPLLCEFDSKNTDKDDVFCKYKDFHIELNEEEECWIEQLETRKYSSPKDVYLCRVLLMYTKELLAILNTNRIIIWGGWSRYSYMLQYVAEKYHIDYGFMEYGWIPGTVQFDTRGIAGQSKYAHESIKLCQLSSGTKRWSEISDVVQFVCREKFDSYISEGVIDEQKEVEKCKNGKTALFIGMSVSGTGIVPGTKYWKENISSVYDSLEEAVIDAAEVCFKNHILMIFKPHPDMIISSDFENKLILHHVLIIKKLPIDLLIMESDIAISMASAVDYKVLMYAKPLVKIGHTVMNKKGCTYEVECRGQLENNILMALKYGQTEKQKTCFFSLLDFLLQNQLWDDLSDRQKRYGKSLCEDFFGERQI